MIAWLFETTIVATILAGFAAMMSRTGRFGPAVRHTLWLIVLVKLVTPPLLNWPFAITLADAAMPAIKNQTEAELTLVAATTDPTFVRGVGEIDPMPSDTKVVDDTSGASEIAEFGNDKTIFAAEESLLPQLSPADDDVGENGQFKDLLIEYKNAFLSHFSLDSGVRLLLFVLCSGSAMFATWQAIRVVKFRSRLVRAGDAPQWIIDQVEELAARMGVQAPGVAVLEGCGAPFLWCAGRPMLVLPDALVKRLNFQRWEGVLAHELAHIRRGDPWVSRLSLAASAIWWWNPLFWFVKRRLDVEAELACDAWVVSLNPGARRSYAEALIDVCESVSLMRKPEPALGVGAEGRLLQRRLIMILKSREPFQLRRGGLLAAFLMAAIAAPSWTRGQEGPSPNPNPPQPLPTPRVLPDQPGIAPPAVPIVPPPADPRVRGTGGDTLPPEITDEMGQDLRKMRDEVNKTRKEQMLKIQEARARLNEMQRQLEAQVRDGEERIRDAERQMERAVRGRGAISPVSPADPSPGGSTRRSGGPARALGALAAEPRPGRSADVSPSEIERLNRRMDSLEQKLDRVLEELRSRPMPPPARRSAAPRADVTPEPAVVASDSVPEVPQPGRPGAPAAPIPPLGPSIGTAPLPPPTPDTIPGAAPSPRRQ